MTERARRTRWSKRRLRALAWATGGATFVLAAAPLVAAPKPPVDSARGPRQPARRVIERHITRRIIIVDPVASVPTSTATGGVTVQAPAAAPAPAPAPPTTTTGGS